MMVQRSCNDRQDANRLVDTIMQIVQANHEYNRALTLDEHMPDAWLNIAALHQQYGQASESIPFYLVRSAGTSIIALVPAVHHIC